MTSLTELLLLVIVIALAACVIVLLLINLALRHMLEHHFKAPKGNFRITMPADQWDAQTAKGAIGVAITDSKGQVYMTLLVQKGEKK